MKTETYQNVSLFARQYAREHGATVHTGHYLHGLLFVDSPVRRTLNEYGITSDIFRQPNYGNGAGSDVENVLLKAQSIANSQGVDCDAIHILLAILASQNCYAYQYLDYNLAALGKSIADLSGFVSTKFPEVFQEISQNSKRPKVATAEVVGSSKLSFNSDANIGVEYSPLQQPRAINATTVEYCTDLTEKARMGAIDPVVGREEEIARIIQTLSRRTKNNPVLTGEAGVGKSAIVEGLALLIVSGKVPLELADKRILELDIAGMVAGSRYRGDFEERFKTLLTDITKSDDVILFIDEIHNLVGAGSSAEKTMDAAEMLKPILARGTIRTIGATTTAEYRKYIEKDPALERRFQPIKVDEPSAEQAVVMLKGIKQKYETHHNVVISDAVVEALVELTVRYLPDRSLPDKAIDVLDEAASLCKLQQKAMPPAMQKQFQRVKALENQLHTNSDAATLRSIEAEYLSAKAAFDNNYRLLQTASKRVEVTTEHIATVISQWTGIPLKQLRETEKEKLLKLEETLAKRVIGQSNAVKAVSLAIRRARTGLKDPTKPIGSFIFVGPTGVGKTELAKALAESMFGSSDEIIRLDMSEYMEKQSVSKLIGAPPGYVGYDESGQLTEKIRKKPYSVLLFDEIEKAHPDVFNILLQILDEGRVTDSHGKLIDFKNTVIILTSNLGSTGAKTVGFGDNYKAMQEGMLDSLKRHFKPEFLNRVDDIIVFERLTKENLRAITVGLCWNLAKRLAGTVELKFYEEAIDYLATVGFNAEYGARPLKRAIQKEVEDLLAERLLTGDIAKGDRVTINVEGGKIVYVVERG
jgi:ATP-dependent Clp protease ATP-binding subunit ClpC